MPPLPRASSTLCPRPVALGIREGRESVGHRVVRRGCDPLRPHEAETETKVVAIGAVSLRSTRVVPP